MGKLVVTEFVSIDGIFEDPGGSESYEYGGWTFEYDRGDDGNPFKLDELMAADATLLAHDLVDELRLMVFPTILGRGRHVFPDGIDRRKFRLVEARTVGPDGVQVQVYEKA